MRIRCGAGPHHSKPRSNPATPSRLNPKRLVRAKKALRRSVLAGRRAPARATPTSRRVDRLIGPDARSAALAIARPMMR